MIGDIFNAYLSTVECNTKAVFERKLCLEITCKRIAEFQILFPNSNFHRKYILNK